MTEVYASGWTGQASIVGVLSNFQFVSCFLKSVVSLSKTMDSQKFNEVFITEAYSGMFSEESFGYIASKIVFSLLVLPFVVSKM